MESEEEGSGGSSTAALKEEQWSRASRKTASFSRFEAGESIMEMR